MPCHLIDATGPYQLPTGWQEVTTAQYCALDAADLRTVEARAGFFAGRPIQVNGYVAEVLAFLLSAPPVEGGLPYPADLGQETYLQVEEIRKLLTERPLHQCFGEVYGIFVARRRGFQRAQFRQGDVQNLALHSEGLPITDTYPAVAHCLAELQRLNTKYAALGLPDTTEAGRRAQEAGADRLAMFSHLNIARHYAEKFSTTIEAIYAKPWEEIALYLYQDRVNAEILDTLQQNTSEKPR